MDAFDLYRAWWTDVASRLGSATCRTYRREIFAGLADVGRHPAEVRTRDWEKHLGEMRPQHASLRRAALMDFHEFLVRKGYRADNPLADLKRQRIGKKKVKRGWTHDELVRIVFAALYLGRGTPGRARVPGTGEQVAYALLAQYGAGLRPSEFLLLSKDHIHLNGTSSHIEVLETKNGDDRIVPLVGVGREAFQWLVDHSPPESNRIMHIGTTRYWELVSRAGHAASIPPEKCRPYAARHTTAAHLAEAGVHVSVIASILGHRDLRATLGYMTPSDGLMRDALGKLGL